MQKPSLASGTRDFSPTEVVKRRYIFSTIESVFVKYGFKPIETPSMENLSTLTGKYGDEGDKLLFKILNSGDFANAKSVKEQDWADRNSNKLTTQIAEKGLRYDLTVPFARYVVMHQNDITFPFRRYQMQPVWRADRPQRGRYREFYQCDADVIGSDSLLNEADLVMIYAEAFEKLGVDVTIKINNRKILYGLSEIVGAKEKFIELITVLDKLDKTDWNYVFQELKQKGFTEEQNYKIYNVIQDAFVAFAVPDKNGQGMLHSLRKHFIDSAIGQKGLDELETILTYLQATNFDITKLSIDLTLARGLNYYTGAIFEVTANNVQMGSIGGGGRYDDLTGIFGLKGVSGVGISFGADRIYDVLEELGKFPSDKGTFTQLLFCCMTEDALAFAMPLAVKARQAGINTEVYPAAAKLKKQLDFANATQIQFAAIIGETEMQNGLLTLKNLDTGEQQTLDIEGVIKLIRG